MRIQWLTVAAAASLATLSWAQSIPSCAAACLESALTNSTCDATDFACICKDTQLMSSVETCTLASCNVIDALSAKNTTGALCGDEIRDNTVVTPVVTAVSGFFAIVAVGMRLFEWHSQSEIHWADLCAVSALVCTVVMGILEFFMSADGFGKDIWTIEPYKIERIVKFTWLTEIFYFAALGLTKITVLLFYLRVFPHNGMKMTCLISIGVCAAFTAAFTLAIIFHCWPIEYGWTSWTGETQGQCFDLNAFVWAHASISIVLDVWIMLIPVTTLLKLQLGTRKKVNLLIMFGIGIFITIVSCIRLSSFSTFANTANPTYDNVATAYWSVLEAYVSVICCCLPAVRSLLRRVLPSCFGSTDGSVPTATYALSKKSGANASTGIKKSVTNVITFQQRSNESDTFELVDGDNVQHTDYKGW